jgi:choline transport protein
MGLPINIVAVLFLLFVWVFTFFPVGPRPTVVDMNWASLGYGCVLICAVVYYVLLGRHVFIGPAEYVITIQM